MITMIVVLIFLIAILASLASALFYLMRGPAGAKKMARALTVRITLSVTLFILLLVAFYFGWITPHPLGA